MLYAVPEVLPKNYPWQIHNHKISSAVWAGFRFDREGKLSPAAADAITKGIGDKPQLEHHLLIGLRNNLAGTEILKKTAVRTRAFLAVHELLRTLPAITAIHIDFEYLPPENAEAFVDFIRELKKKIRSEIRVYTAVFPPIGLPERWSALHDLPGLVSAGDGIVVMLYDYHGPWSGSGCVSGIGWLNENARALASLPRHKVWLGAPLYGYRFEKKKATAIGKKGFEKITGATENNDGCLIKKTNKGTAYYPSVELYGRYDQLVHELGFAGIAYWRAGLE